MTSVPSFNLPSLFLNPAPANFCFICTWWSVISVIAIIIIYFNNISERRLATLLYSSAVWVNQLSYSIIPSGDNVTSISSYTCALYVTGEFATKISSLMWFWLCSQHDTLLELLALFYKQKRPQAIYSKNREPKLANGIFVVPIYCLLAWHRYRQLLQGSPRGTIRPLLR